MEQTYEGSLIDTEEKTITIKIIIHQIGAIGEHNKHNRDGSHGFYDHKNRPQCVCVITLSDTLLPLSLIQT